jgi:catechol 2,3-dioxygenase-like lactoylglutathione lyase family enzyme
MTPLIVHARRVALVSGLIAVSAITASAQLLATKDGPVVYGHHHLNVTSIDAHKKIWVDTLGGKSVKVGTSPNEIVMFPNVLVFLRQQAPTGGTKGTTVNHIAFAVKDVRQMRDKARAAGYPIVTREEAGAGDVVTDDVSFNKEQGSYSIFVMGPDEIKVQFFEVKNSPTPIVLHHIHFAGPAAEMRDWYVKQFGAKPGTRGVYVTANLPGVDLSFGQATNVVATRGRVLDHIGFEVKNLEAFLKKLESEGVKIDRPYTKVPALNIAIAFIQDPWGTYIELTDGLREVR